jgi:hypothetical protein
MNDGADDLMKVLGALVVWVESVAVRLTAQEAVIKQKLGITEEQWRQALEKAREEFPEPSALRADGLPAIVIDFLMRATKS